MALHHSVFLGVFFLMTVSAVAQTAPARAQERLPPTYMPSGSAMYKQYCAACHGSEGKGNGPAAYALKIPPANLATLAKRHMGKFPHRLRDRGVAIRTGRHRSRLDRHAHVGTAVPDPRQAK